MSTSDTFEEGHNAKRRKLDELANNNTLWNDHQYSKVLKKLTYDAYTVGWICALPLELAAARSMLDEEHETLDLPFRDHNTYCLGTIAGHNIVLCCLPVGEYGTTSATKVASNMVQTFPNSRTLSLLVGIGGGVPSMNHDIRLGDVVVSVSRAGNPPVKQYDYGKTVANGYSIAQGSLNKPASILSTAVAKLIAEHKLGQSKISTFMMEAIRKYSLKGYEYPGADFDTAPEYHCAQNIEGSKCDVCGLTKTASRTARISTDPAVHYGTIGSGNQVMKDSCTRDTLARQHDIICFEMEAAGLMDDMQCLVIRGVCDYSDANKTKVFQDYSALAAAAYAKELLLTVSPRHSRLAVNASKDVCQEVLNHRKTLMEALDFEEAESRRITIQKAHSQTCKWFLTQQEYLDWLDLERLPQHHGLLWLRGKAGCGKSTLMKYLVDNMENLERQKSTDTIIISFFFNARGSELERSTIGMYRSLLYQLLKKIPEFKYLLDKASRASNFDSVGTLRYLFEEALQELQEISVFCFVDALDECPEDQIQDMITFFEGLGDSAIQSKSRWHVCFSSRYYPNISTRACISLELDQRDGHADDIKKYIDTELKAGTDSSAEALKAEIAEKSGRIFLWVVLVVRILKRLFDRGRGNRIKEMRNKLKEIPLELDQLFHDILTRDNNNMAELVVTIQWLLYSQRPLKCEELYFAIQSGDQDIELDHLDAEQISTSCMDDYILDCSKGLVELTRSKSSSAQFIHESVREFLLKPGALESLWPESGAISESKSHYRLFECCWRYMTFSDADKLDLPKGFYASESPASFRRETLRKFPFLEYATRNLLYHANYTAEARLLKPSFCHNLDVNRYIGLYNILARYMSEQFKGTNYFSGKGDLNFLLLLAVKGLSSLLSFWIQTHSIEVSKIYDFGHGLVLLVNQKLYKHISPEIFKSIMPNPGDVGELELALLDLLKPCEDNFRCRTSYHGEEFARLLLAPLIPPEQTTKQALLNEALCIAALHKEENAVKCLLNAGAQPNSINGSALQAATDICLPHAAIQLPYYDHINQNPHILVQAASLMRELIQRGAKLEDGPRTMQNCVEWADATVARIIWDETSWDVPISTKTFDLFMRASKHPNLRVLPFLFEKGVDFGSHGISGYSPLDLAIEENFHHKIKIVEWLMQHGAMPRKYKSPICHVISCYQDAADAVEMSRMLSPRQSFVNQTDEHGNTPLLLAISKNNLSIVRILLCHGADLNQADQSGQTPWDSAVTLGNVNVAKVLKHYSER